MLYHALYFRNIVLSIKRCFCVFDLKQIFGIISPHITMVIFTSAYLTSYISYVLLYNTLS